MYVLQNIDRDSKYFGDYVAISGMYDSYTKNIDYVRKFHTIREAEDSRCIASEIIVRME